MSQIVGSMSFETGARERKLQPMKSRPRIGFLIFDGITALDLVGPAEAFGCARRGPSTAPERLMSSS